MSCNIIEFSEHYINPRILSLLECYIIINKKVKKKKMKTIPSHHLTIGFTGINGLHEVYILSKCLKHLCRLYRLFFHSNIALKTFLQNHPLARSI